MTLSVTWGIKLYRWRSLTPVPVLTLLLWLIWRSGPSYTTPVAVDALLSALGIVCSLVGQVLRFWTTACVPEGTSGQGWELEARQLNTRGPYAYVRNPLYLGNLLICLGLLFVVNQPWIYVIGLSFFFGQYSFIIRAEERFLFQTYGEQFEAYASRVRRWIPRLRPAEGGKLGGFDLRRALRKEHNPFAAWTSAMLLLVGWKYYLRGNLSTTMLALLVGLEGATIAFYLTIKGLKRGWFGEPLARLIHGPPSKSVK